MTLRLTPLHSSEENKIGLSWLFTLSPPPPSKASIVFVFHDYPHRARVLRFNYIDGKFRHVFLSVRCDTPRTNLVTKQTIIGEPQGLTWIYSDGTSKEFQFERAAFRGFYPVGERLLAISRKEGLVSLERFSRGKFLQVTSICPNHPGDVYTFTLNPFDQTMILVQMKTRDGEDLTKLVIYTDCEVTMSCEIPHHTANVTLFVNANNFIVGKMLYTVNNATLKATELVVPQVFQPICRYGRAAIFANHVDVTVRDGLFHFCGSPVTLLAHDLSTNETFARCSPESFVECRFYDQTLYMRSTEGYVRVDLIGYDRSVQNKLRILSESKSVPDDIRVLFGVVLDHEASLDRRASGGR